MTAAIPESIPGFGFVWQVVTVFTFVGGLVAYRQKRRRPDVDVFLIVTRYRLLGLALGDCLVPVLAGA